MLTVSKSPFSCLLKITMSRASAIACLLAVFFAIDPVLHASLVSIAPNYPGSTRWEKANQGAFAALRQDGSVLTWGNKEMGGDSSSVSNSLATNVTDIFSSPQAFAALKLDGSVVAWGQSSDGGDVTYPSDVRAKLTSGVIDIFSTGNNNGAAFAALKTNGSVVTWGDPGSGGDSSSVSNNLRSGVTSICSTESAFAALIKINSSYLPIAWGDPSSGGDVANFTGSSQIPRQLFSTAGAFAVINYDKSVGAWGDPARGGDCTAVEGSLIGVTNIYSTRSAFAALTTSGAVIAWGDPNNGGNETYPVDVRSKLTNNVVDIYSTAGAFAALKKDGSVVVWGNSSYYTNNYGGYANGAPTNQLTSVAEIFTTAGAFAAVKTTGSVVVWGDAASTGLDGYPYPNPPAATVTNLTGVQSICPSLDAFAALQSGGSVSTWGNTSDGGDSSLVSNRLTSGAQVLFATESAFAAFKSNGSIITWGDPGSGGAVTNPAVASKLSNGVVVLASPFTKILGAPQTIPVGSITNISNVLSGLSYSNNETIQIPSQLASSGLPLVLSVQSGPATIVTNALGYRLTLNGAGSVTLAVDQPGNTNYRAASELSTGFSVGKGTQHIIFPGITNSLTYTTNPTLNPFKITLPVANSGLPVTSTVVGAAASLSGNTLRILGAGAFTLSVTNAGNSNYFPASFSTNFVIAKGGQAIKLPSISGRTFSTNQAANVFATTLPSLSSVGLVVTNTVSGPASLSGNRITVTGAGTVTILSTNGGGANYLPASASTNFVVAKAAQSITFPTIPNRNLSANPASNSLTITPTSTSLLPVNSLVVSGPASLSNNTLIVTGPGTITIAASQAGNSNFLSAASVTNKFIVGKIPQVITFAQPAPQTYESNGLVALSASAPGGQVSFTSSATNILSIIGTNAVIHGAGSAVITAQMGTNQIATNYLGAASVTRTVTIAKASQSIPAFVPISPAPYGSIVTLTNTNSSASLPVTYSVKSGPASLHGNFVTITGVGTVTLAANQSGNGNYLAAPQVTTSITTTKATQSITFVPPSVIPVGATLALTATSSSGLSVTYSNATPALATLSGSSLTPKTNGVITIIALQAGNSNYLPAANITNNITVEKAQSIAFAPPSSLVFTNNGTFQLLATASPSALPVTYTSSNTNTLSISGSIATMHAKGTVSVTASQSGGSGFAPAASVTKTITLH